MKKAWILLSVVALVLCAAGGELAAQEQPRGPQLQFGPFLGATGIVISPDAFNAAMQTLYPSATSYFPVFTQMGFGAQQLVALGESGASLAFHEIFLLAGLDQNMPVPNLNLILAYRIRGGFEIGLGPYITFTAPSGSLQLSGSAVYLLGWTIAARGFSMPILLTVVPVPSYANPRISLLVGFSFEALE